ncbi:hypothetical protein H310_09131 [Aphanomyces invadans]|uniref:Uncharacterized protein n=1 Tax=Aphanomyces invadans TaxID=157072 RepID=A0A024TUW7_9STRA|nr:hypothetical protein H310_09131 [Aphanomyces invadans]ETV97779.1 hypothetical protein H310_09131 [Aphanomyces invadans]|eukprot:XP_008873340.1 hypothetical protein H310_09131 [Aphanomyces invadans]
MGTPMPFSALFSNDLLPCILAYQGGIHHKLLEIVAAVRVLQSATCATPSARAVATHTLHVWFHCHHVPGLRELYRVCPDVASHGTFLVYASSIGQVHAVKYLLAHHHPSHHGPAVLQATLHGHLAVLQAFHDARTPDGFTSYVFTLAATHGHLDIIKFLHQHRATTCDTLAMDNAAKHGHLGIVEFLHRHREEGCTVDAMDGAAENGHIDVVEFLHRNRREGCTKRAMEAAAARGHKDVVRFLHLNRREGCHATAMDSAAERGDASMVQFLHWNRIEGCTVHALALAAANGHGDIVDFLLMFRTEGCVKQAMAAAASAGHDDVVQRVLAHQGQMCVHNCECPVEWPTRSVLCIGVEEAKAHGQWSTYKLLKGELKWKDRRQKWSHNVARAWQLQKLFKTMTRFASRRIGT